MPIYLKSKRYNFPYEVQVDDEIVIPRDSSGDPATLAGAIRYNPTSELPQYFDGVVWKDMGGGGGGGPVIGTATFTGNGLNSVFLIPHGQAFTPTEFIIDPITNAAQGIYSKTADATNLIITYDISPVGTLTFNYTIEVP